MAVYGSMLVPTRARTTNTGQGYVSKGETYTPGQNASARLSDSAAGVLSSAASQQAQSLAGLTRGLNQMNQGLTDAYIDHHKMVGQNMATEYRQRVNDALYGENGILTREGESSFSCRQDAEAKMKEISDELQKGYEGSLAGNFFRQNTDSFISDTVVKAQQYQDKQYGKWLDDGDTAFITQSIDLAVSSYADGNAFSRHLGEATNRIRAMGKRNGINADMIEKNVRDSTSAAFLQSVKQAIGDKNLEAAQRILKQGMAVHRDPNPHDLSKPDGLVSKATADFNNRKVLRTKDEEGNEVIKTVQTMTLETDDGKFIVLPTIIDGKEFSPEDAIAYSKKTGKHFGVFDSQEHADDFAQKLHENHAVQYGPGRVYMKPSDITQAKAFVQHEIDRRAAEAERARIRAERQHAAAVRSLVSGKEWKDAVYRAEHMNDPTALAAIQSKLEKMGEKGMASELGDQIKTIQYVAKHAGDLKDLPLPEAQKRLVEMRGELEKAREAGDIASHKKLTAGVAALERAVTGLEKAASAEARSLVQGAEWDNAVFEATQKGDTQKLGEIAMRLDELGADGLASAVRENMVTLHELRGESEKLGKGTLSEQKAALSAFGTAVSESVTAKEFDLRSKAYAAAEKQFNERVKLLDSDPGQFAAEIVKQDFEANGDSNGDAPTLAKELQERVEVQRRNGVLPDHTAPLTKREVELYVSKYAVADDKAKQLRAFEQECGEAWPMVYEQLAKSGKFPSNFQLLATVHSPVAASILSQSAGKPGYFGSVADTIVGFDQNKRQELKDSVRAGLAAALKTMNVAGDSLGAAMIEKSACDLAVTYVSQGFPAPVAARRAADECMNERYSFSGTYRIPREYDAARVKAGVDIAIANILEHPERVPIPADLEDYLSQFSVPEAKSKKQVLIRKGLTVTTNSNETGVNIRLNGELLRELTESGYTGASALNISFDDLMKMKRERVSSSESDILTDEAKAVRPWH